MSADTLGRVRASAGEWKEAQASVAAARRALIRDIKGALRKGASEVGVARAAGVSRTTLRGWLGKGGS